MFITDASLSSTSVYQSLSPQFIPDGGGLLNQGISLYSIVVKLLSCFDLPWERSQDIYFDMVQNIGVKYLISTIEFFLLLSASN